MWAQPSRTEHRAQCGRIPFASAPGGRPGHGEGEGVTTAIMAQKKRAFVFVRVMQSRLILCAKVILLPEFCPLSFRKNLQDLIIHLSSHQLFQLVGLIQLGASWLLPLLID